MKQNSKTATVESAFGKKLDTPIEFTFGWTSYETPVELDAAGDGLSKEEQVRVRNTQRENRARQRAQAAAFEAAGIVRPTEENDDQLRLRNMFKTLMSSKKYTEEAARKMASDVLGIEWADDDSE